MSSDTYSQALSLGMPLAIPGLAAFAALAVDLGPMRQASLLYRRWFGAVVVTLGCAGALLWIIGGQPVGALPKGVLVSGPVTWVIHGALLFAAAAAAWVAAWNRTEDHVGEYSALLLLGTVGLMLMTASTNLLVIFLGLELASLVSYCLVAFDKRRADAASAALNYFLYGGMAAAFMLFGLSWVFGASGRLDFEGISAALKTPSYAASLGMLLVVVGFAFKLAAAPFHLWAPDAYAAAPTPVAAFIGSGSKLASLVALGQTLNAAFGGMRGSAGWSGFTPGWATLIALLAVVSMVLGNFAAIQQRDFKRLLAFSAVAHGGYALVGVLAGGAAGVTALAYYGTSYALSVIGAFAVANAIERRGGGTAISDLAGLSRREPFLAFALLVFLLSLAGIPPLAGFFGKFYVFAVALKNSPEQLGLTWLVILAIATSTLSLYYYLQVLKQAYVVEGGENNPTPRQPLPLDVAVTLALLCLLVLGFGMAPEQFLAAMASPAH